ncbi:MAG: FG-GAP-like repeat-containing protein [Planctomycetes bacterium]|nr:FG-GAP-like repeat-containing protein [Planctomycetota bacterium]
MPAPRRRFQVAPALSIAILAIAPALIGGCGDDASKPAAPVAPSNPAAAPLRPEDAATLVALSNKGIALLERYDYVAAQKPFREAMKLAPTWIPGRIHMALALIHSGPESRPEARKLIDDVLRDAPTQPHAAFLAAWLAENAGEPEKAIDLYRKAYTLTGEDPICGAKLGTLLAGIEGKEQEAYDLLMKVHARRPALISPVNQLMLLNRVLGREAEAETYLAKLRALKGRLRDDVDTAKLGEEMRDAYGNMGRFSMAIRDFDPPAGGAADAAAAKVTAKVDDVPGWTAGALPEGAFLLGAAAADFDNDGDVDVFVCGGKGPSALFRNDGGALVDVAKASGVAIEGAYAVAAGEFDTDPSATTKGQPGRRARVDLVVATPAGLKFLRGAGDGTFTDATADTGLAADPGTARALLSWDADQDGDLDLFVSGVAGAKNRLWANKGPGVFTDATADSGLAGDGDAYGPAVVVDYDEDYDLDLVVSRPTKAPAIFSNDRLLKFHGVDAPKGAGPATCGAISGDFDSDGHEDVVLAVGAGGTLLRGTGRGFEASGIPMTGGVAADVDLRSSGARDLFCSDGSVLYVNDGPSAAAGVFRSGAYLQQMTGLANVLAADFDGDGVEDVLRISAGAPVQRVTFSSTDRGHAVTLDLEGVIRNDVQAGWSNIEGRGAIVEVKAGAMWQQRRVGNPSGYGCSSPARQVAGIGTAKQADFVRILWPDAVQQAALDIASGPAMVLMEEQRRPDSCPILFSWDGERWVFVTDFIGVGGVGFLVAPGVYGAPDPTESVKVDASMVKPIDGKLVFKSLEPMEEVCYLDAADLVVVDHPAAVTVQPDERFAGEPPFPNGDLLAYRDEILPVAAKDERGADVLDRIAKVDRRYPDAFKLHPRLYGATAEAVLELDFGDRLNDVAPGDGIVFYGNGWIEYGYTRTTVAAAGEGFAYQVPTLEVWDQKAADGKGAWKTIVAALGYPAGFPRVMTYDLTGLVSRDTPRLRVRTNFEIYWDKVWLARKADVAKETRQTVVPAESADLRWVGYPREFSPDGRIPRIYDYGTMDPTMPWKTVAGDYTKFGDVTPLVAKADDMYVIHGKGEEIELTFDAAKLPPLPAGWTRSYVLRFTGWCKGQELYTAHGWTVEPLPFLGMSNYPYRADEHYPDDAAHREYRKTWNTRRVNAPSR